MKKKALLVIVLLGVALLILLLKRHGAPPAILEITNQTERSELIERLPTNNPRNMPDAVLSDAATYFSNRTEQHRIAVEQSLEEWRTPIQFYGKVVDQNGNQVANARINFSCNDLSHDGTSFYQSLSDADGQFSITKIQGKLLTVKVEKDGYYSSKRDNAFFYYAGQSQNFKPDSTQPVVFKLRKKGQAEPLVATDYPGFAKIEQLKGDGTPVEIDILKGEKVATGNGQLKLEFWRDAPQTGVKRFNWKVKISAVGGGLVVTDEEFNFFAVENGYEPFDEIEMRMDKDKWQNELRRNYYLQMRDGKYSRIEIYVLARNGVYHIQSFTNPSGSRNLEYDEAVQPKPTVQE